MWQSITSRLRWKSNKASGAPLVSSENLFKHTPLDQAKNSIRLVRILPDLHQGHVQCQIIDSTPASTYKAVSYTWGECGTGDERWIFVNGNKFSVRPNLWAFLNQARGTILDQLWVDALSIDQDNISERNHQVRLMSEIFKAAEEVLVWLGSDTLSTPEFDSLVRFGDNPHIRLHAADDIDMQERCMLAPRKCDLTPYKNVDFSPTLWHILTLSYWERLWIIQEFCLAKKVTILSGNRSIAWESLKAALILKGEVYEKSAERSDASLDDEIMKTATFIKLLRYDVDRGLPYQPLDLGYLLKYFGQAKCREAQDRVYGLLSLARNGHSFPVDYGCDIEDLFLKTLFFCAESTQNSDAASGEDLITIANVLLAALGIGVDAAQLMARQTTRNTAWGLFLPTQTSVTLRAFWNRGKISQELFCSVQCNWCNRYSSVPPGRNVPERGFCIRLHHFRKTAHLFLSDAPEQDGEQLVWLMSTDIPIIDAGNEVIPSRKQYGAAIPTVHTIRIERLNEGSTLGEPGQIHRIKMTPKLVVCLLGLQSGWEPGNGQID